MESLRKRHTYQPIWTTLLRNIIKWSKQETITAPMINENSLESDKLLREAVLQQNEIGWDHILKGWLSKKWSEAQENYYAERARSDSRIQRNYHNGIAWSKHVAVEFQHLAFQVWKFRNKDIYGHTKLEEEQQQLHEIRRKVRKEYERRLSYSTRNQW